MYIDIIIGVLLLWGAYRGFTKGFIIQVASLAALLLGIYGAFKFSSLVSHQIQNIININAQYLPLISFIITFLVIVIAIHFMAKIIEKFIDLVALGFFNKLAGAIFGILKAAFVLSVILLIVNIADKKLKFIPSEEKNRSVLYEHVSYLLPAIIPGVKKLLS